MGFNDDYDLRPLTLHNMEFLPCLFMNSDMNLTPVYILEHVAGVCRACGALRSVGPCVCMSERVSEGESALLESECTGHTVLDLKP